MGAWRLRGLERRGRRRTTMGSMRAQAVPATALQSSPLHPSAHVHVRLTKLHTPLPEHGAAVVVGHVSYRHCVGTGEPAELFSQRHWPVLKSHIPKPEQ